MYGAVKNAVDDTRLVAKEGATGVAKIVGNAGAEETKLAVAVATGAVVEGASSSLSSTTTLYRAVSSAELTDIGQNGFRMAPGSYETGKLFAISAEDAAQFGKNNFHL